MFLHIGGDTSISIKDIIFILDLASAALGAPTREFIETSQREGLVTTVNHKEPKSLIVTTERIYLSAISSLTLLGRSRLVV
ncbi:MAG: DUF370 domain-containing protein [Firmicutes bacterium]|nr:DUF370 domain-containing protein [Bacillota bacterium]